MGYQKTILTEQPRQQATGIKSQRSKQKSRIESSSSSASDLRAKEKERQARYYAHIENGVWVGSTKCAHCGRNFYLYPWYEVKSLEGVKCDIRGMPCSADIYWARDSDGLVRMFWKDGTRN